MLDENTINTLQQGWDEAGISKEYQEKLLADIRGNNDKETKEKAGLIGNQDVYMSDGDDYYIDESAFAGAQLGTGDNSTAASVAGSGGSNGSSETNSNINTGVFGGPARAAKPGASLW